MWEFFFDRFLILKIYNQKKEKRIKALVFRYLYRNCNRCMSIFRCYFWRLSPSYSKFGRTEIPFASPKPENERYNLQTNSIILNPAILQSFLKYNLKLKVLLCTPRFTLSTLREKIQIKCAFHKYTFNCYLHFRYVSDAL